MKKTTILLALAIMLGGSALAQNVEETTVRIGELTVPAYTVTLEKDSKVVQNAMNKRLKDAKLKTKNTDGYVASLQQVFAELAATPVNFYTKVDKVNGSAVVTVCAMSTDLSVDQMAIKNNVNAFLSAFPQYVDRYEAATQLAVEQEKLKKAEKTLKSANKSLSEVEKDQASDLKSLSKKKKKIESMKKEMNNLEKEVSALESAQEKYDSKRAAAQQKVDEAQEAVKAAQQAVDRYQQLAK